MGHETGSKVNVSQEDALQVLASYYKRRAGEFEEGLVVSNALIEKLKQRIAELEADAESTE